MTEAEFLQRLDRNTAAILDHVEASRGYMKRGDELMEAIREEMRLNRAEARLHREESRRSAEAFADLRTFTRDLTRRNEVVWREVREELREIADVSRAQTAAILKVLDRLEPQTG